MSLAERTRGAVRDRPFLHEALRAGVVNYTAAARFLDIGDEEVVAAALRRYADELDEYDPPAGSVRVRMESGVGRVDADESAVDALLAVGDSAFALDAGSLTAVLATGEVSVRGATRVLGRCDAAGVDVVAAGVTDDALALVVERRDGPDALRIVEEVIG